MVLGTEVDRPWWLQSKPNPGQQFSCWFADCGPCIVRALWSLYGTPGDTCMGDMLPETFFSLLLCGSFAFVSLVEQRGRESLISTPTFPPSTPIFFNLFPPPNSPATTTSATPSLSLGAKRLDRRVPRPLAVAIDWKGEAARSPWWIGSFSSRQQVSAKHPCHL